jgi:hypothetical protein
MKDYKRSMKLEVIARKISKKSLFNLLFIGLFFGIGSFVILCGLAALLGAETITWNEESKTGLEGLLYSFLLAPMISGFFAGFFWVFLVIGLWIYSFINPLKITFKYVQSNVDENA